MSDGVRVLLFAGVRDAVGAAEIVMPASEATSAAAVLDALCARCPGLGEYVASLRVAVNGSYVGLEEPVREGDEVAVIPPVAGG